jgi:serpin B
MDRRSVLALAGALATTTLAGCRDATEGPNPGTSRQTPATGAALPAGDPGPTDERLATLVTGTAGFGLDLNRELAVTGGRFDNHFVSPYGLGVALAMTYAGARSDTREAIADALKFSADAAVHTAYEDLQTALGGRATVPDRGSGEAGGAETTGVRMRVATALWLADSHPVAEPFEATLADHYGGGLERGAFGEDAAGERDRINDWVADRTGGHVRDLLGRTAVTPDTRLVVPSAATVAAAWERPFDPAATEPGTFTALDGSESSVPMMRGGLQTPYAEVNGHQVVELPYVGGSVSMVVVLPAEGTFDSFEEHLRADHLFGLFEALEESAGRLTVPRFEHATDRRLKTVLSELGVSAAFTDDADLSGMVRSAESPWIDDLHHGTVVTVDERGTGPRATTPGADGGSVDDRSFDVTVDDKSFDVTVDDKSFDVTVDRPFLFCIRDRPTDALLFLGRVVDAGATTDPGPAGG